MTASTDGPKDATPITDARNRALLDVLPFDDTQDFEDARRGFLGTLPEAEIQNEQGRVVWSLADETFLGDEHAPHTVNPSLWRQARLNKHHGLFRVTDRIYQERGFDASNMTLIEGDRGLIVIDPLISTEVARAGLDLYSQHRGRRPVTAVIYTHSHVDHYGYAAESATWRNAYLFGALELRQGLPTTGGRALLSSDAVRAMSLDLFFDYLGVRLNGDKAAGKVTVINWVFSDLGRRYVMTLDNCALTYPADRASDRVDATVTLERAVLNRLILRETPFVDAVQRGLVGVEGDPAKVAELFSLLDDFTPMFEVVEPRPEP